MLQKKDLSKQFELVVKQEIKNYQDSLNFILQSIRDLKDDVAHVKNESLESFAVIHSLQSNLAILFQDMKDEQKRLRKKIDDTLADFKDLSKCCEKEKSYQNSVLGHHSHLHNLHEINESNIDSRLEGLSKEIEDTKKHLTQLCERSYNKFSQELLKTKDEILCTPSPVEKLYQMTHEKISSQKVDVDGIMKEIRANRYDMMVFEKKFEHIYTLIERLKKAGGNP